MSSQNYGIVACIWWHPRFVACWVNSRSTTPQAGYQKGPGTDYSGIDHTQRPRTESSPICEIPKKTKISARHKHTNTPGAGRIKLLVNRNTKKRSTQTQKQATRPTPTQTRHRTDGHKHRHRQNLRSARGRVERHVGAIGVERVQGVVDEVKHILLRRLMLGDAPRKLSNCYKQTETVNTHTLRQNS